MRGNNNLFLRVGFYLLVFFHCYHLSLVAAFSNSQPQVPKVVQELHDAQGGPYAFCQQTELLETMEEDTVDEWYPTTRTLFEFTTLNNVKNATKAQFCIRETSFGCGGLGYCVWSSAVALGLTLLQHPQWIHNRRVLELGAGCGLPSRLCWELGAAAVLATDFWEQPDTPTERKDVVPDPLHALNLQYNTQTAVQRVDWNDLETVRQAQAIFQPDIILGSDLVYYPVNVQPLLDTLQELLPLENNPKSAQFAVLMSPLPPDHEREGLPEFRQRLPQVLPHHAIDMHEVTLVRPQMNGKKERFLRTIITRQN